MNTNFGCLKLSQGIVLKGKIIKNGLDTSRLINIIICFNSPEEFRMAGYPSPPNLFYINDISFDETVGILINKFNFTKEQAILKVREWYNKVLFQRIPQGGIDKIIPLVREKNKEVVKEFGKEYETKENDIKIISSFIKEGVNIVHTGDKGFRETCKKLNINIINIPSRDFKLEEEIRKRLSK